MEGIGKGIGTRRNERGSSGSQGGWGFGERGEAGVRVLREVG
jgi:hypothetical protein